MCNISLVLIKILISRSISWVHLKPSRSFLIFFSSMLIFIVDKKNLKKLTIRKDPKLHFFSFFIALWHLSSWTDLRCMISSTNNQATGWSDSSSSPSRDLITKFNLKEFFKPIQKSDADVLWSKNSQTIQSSNNNLFEIIRFLHRAQ